MNLQEAKSLSGDTLFYDPDKIVGEGAEKVYYRVKDRKLVIGLYKNDRTEEQEERLRRLKKLLTDYNPTPVSYTHLRAHET